MLRSLRYVPALALLGSAPLLFAVLADAPPAWFIAALFFDSAVLGALAGRGRAGPFGGLPPVPPGPLRTRFEELAAALRLPVPELVLMGTGELLLGAAFAAGPLRPRVIVSDGLLHRFEARQRDAVIAHELSHLANGSLWVFPVSAMLGEAIALALAGSMGAGAVLVALPVAVVVHQVLTRWYEVRCDLSAGRLVGHAAMAGALDRVYAMNGPRTGIPSALLDAVGPHPSLAVRKAALRRAAPPAERTAMPAPATVGDRLRAALALGLALAGIGWAVGVGPAGGGVLLAIAATPVLVIRGFRARAAEHLGAPRWRAWRAMVATVVAISGSAGLLTAGAAPEAVGVAWIVGLVVAGWVRLLTQQSPRNRLLRHYLARRYPQAAALADRHPHLAADRVLAPAVATARFLAGHSEQAFAGLDRAVERWPGEPTLRVMRGLLLLVDAPERALAEGLALTKEKPEDPRGWCVAARAARRLGQRDLADGLAAGALRTGAASPRSLAVAALAALDRGDLAKAASHLEAGERNDPSNTWIEVARAEVAVVGGLPDAEAALARAADAVRANPGALLDGDLQRLQALRVPAAPQHATASSPADPSPG